MADKDDEIKEIYDHAFVWGIVLLIGLLLERGEIIGISADTDTSIWLQLLIAVPLAAMLAMGVGGIAMIAGAISYCLLKKIREIVESKNFRAFKIICACVGIYLFVVFYYGVV